MQQETKETATSRRRLRGTLAAGALGAVALTAGALYAISPAPAPTPQEPARTVPTASVDTPPTPEENVEEERRYREMALREQVKELLCEETAQRYMAARTGVQLARSIHISQANGCGWRYIMAEDAKTHDLTPEALAAAADIEESDVPAADGGAGEAASRMDAMSRKLSDQEAEITRLRYRTNYR